MSEPKQLQLPDWEKRLKEAEKRWLVTVQDRGQGKTRIISRKRPSKVK